MVVGFAGHREYKNRELIQIWIDGIKKTTPDATIMTGGQVGVDLIAAECAIKSGLRHHLVLPMLPRVFAKNWGNRDKRRLDDVIEKSVEVTTISVETAKERLRKDANARVDFIARYEKEFLFERNQYIAEHCDVLVAFWTGKDSGTAHTVSCALANNREVVNGISGRIIEKDDSLADRVRPREACIEGYESLQEDIGYQEFAQTALSADIEVAESTVFERHEVIGDVEKETAIAARVYASCLCFPYEAKEAAEMILILGTEYEDYFRGRMKKEGFDTPFKELKRLTEGIKDILPSKDDVLEQDWVQAYNDDPSEDTGNEQISADATYGWHKIGEGREYIDPGLPLAVDKTAEWSKRIKTAGKREIGRLGKELYKKTTGMTYEQRSYLWKVYKERKKQLRGS